MARAMDDKESPCDRHGAVRAEYGLNHNCNVQLADEIMLISITSLIVIFALSNLLYTKHAQ